MNEETTTQAPKKKKTTVILAAAHGGASLQITQFRSAAEFKEQMKTILRPVAWQQASAFLR